MEALESTSRFQGTEEMITKLRIQNFKALRDVELALTPIHVLIGPNDSGKTSILDALAALCRSVDHDLPNVFLRSWNGEELVWAGFPSASAPVTIEVEFEKPSDMRYGINIAFGPSGKNVVVEDEYIDTPESRLRPPHMDAATKTAVRSLSDDPRFASDPSDELGSVRQLLDGVHYYRWDPAFLSLAVALDAKRRFRMESNGFGLALCLDEILNYSRELFAKIEKRFTGLFPHIDSIVLQQESAYRAPVDAPDRVTMLQKADGKGLYLRLKDSSQLIPASQASDGTLLVLAYLAILHLPQPPRVLLVEEPENGIHPKRLRDVLMILRELIGEQSHTQVLMTTHSPYVVDLFEPEEVTLCTKLPNGEVKTTRMSDSETVRKQIDVFTLGEIWTGEDDETIAGTKEPAEESHE